LHITPGTSLNGLEAVARQSAGALAILLDSATSDRLGGTGATHDWSVSGEIVRLSPVPVILAGGLWRDNVRAAITQVRPAGIDLNTGAREQRDRHRPQSAARVRELVQEVRAVEARLPAPKLSLAW
ncbi:MAG TPA: hypothetical protein VHH73_20720, partial [Verrucomicrobiae bacterium]|nr:hypothetical protein [Verrucomicrobiae bacterium]